jgi:hypothetical protein
MGSAPVREQCVRRPAGAGTEPPMPTTTAGTTTRT